ncbi:MAG: arginine N-succinyltransferase [Deltaproteobacteria bacterium]|nr:arginine N-succinyltransferase [Deltaproteobacteria bacterium]
MTDHDVRFEIRGVTKDDRADLLELARFLDSVNLPNDAAAMEPIIRRSERSFSGTEGDPRRREHVFVLYDRQEQRAVGTSLIVGQLGRRDAPYIYFDVTKEERYSQTLDRYFVHDVLSIGYSYNGPTEIGGLVMHPEYRRNREKLGMQISYIRFLFIAMHRADFQNHVLAELLPPLESDGTSHLWEAVGRHFTGMSYREADRLSRRNKEFIRGLFPHGEIYASLLPEAAQRVIGEVGRETKGVAKLLQRIGFRYVNRVDPFDGGPHFAAPTDQISLIQNAEALSLELGAVGEGARRHLVARDIDGPPWFRACAIPAEVSEGRIRVPERASEALQAADGDPVWALPLD